MRKRSLHAWTLRLLVAAVAWVALEPGVGASNGPLIFAKVPSDGAGDKLATRYGNLTRALGEALGREVVFQSRPSYDRMGEAMRRGEFDIVSVGPALYVQHEARYEPVVRPVRFKRSSYRGLLLVRAESRFKTLKDLSGARVGFVSERSTSGYLLPALMLERAGLDLKRDFADVRFYKGRHPDVAVAVTSGEVDAGAVYDDARIDAFGQDAKMRAETRVLAATERIPNDPIVVHKRLPASVRAAIQQFFEGLSARPADEVARLVGPLDEQVQGWVRTTSADYDPVRAWASALERAERGN
ncbi:MAG: phosphate/phosphite/phosphonate ABC transporter substrate-binding protein [Candidatus Sericytochromatia bacterium]|nr:phosphate/phosphite/phosphonate ABC transporter substrate-binding protein [Candidatus Sericytochromatia bacterium]